MFYKIIKACSTPTIIAPVANRTKIFDCIILTYFNQIWANFRHLAPTTHIIRQYAGHYSDVILAYSWRDSWLRLNSLLDILRLIEPISIWRHHRPILISVISVVGPIRHFILVQSTRWKICMSFTHTHTLAHSYTFGSCSYFEARTQLFEIIEHYHGEVSYRVVGLIA